MLLIFSNKQDFAADYMILRLEEHRIPFLRINSEDIGEMHFSFSVDDRGVTRRLRTPTHEIDFREVSAVWLRRQLQPSLDWIPTEYKAFASVEMRSFLDAFVMLHNCTWVNSAAATHLAERKLYVLERAKILGIPTPTTIATNDAEAFHSRDTGNWIAKPLYQGIHLSHGQLHALYTQRISDFGAIGDDEISALPCIFQREIVRGRDLRLTFVGEQGFGAVVFADTKHDVDWRRPENRAQFEPYKIPDILSRWCQSLMSDLGLVYGAFDFIEDRDGQPWFLEVNPAGEFAWLEVQLGLPIRDALIEAFLQVTT